MIGWEPRTRIKCQCHEGHDYKTHTHILFRCVEFTLFGNAMLAYFGEYILSLYTFYRVTSLYLSLQLLSISPLSKFVWSFGFNQYFCSKNSSCLLSFAFLHPQEERFIQVSLKKFRVGISKFQLRTLLLCFGISLQLASQFQKVPNTSSDLNNE